VKRFYRGLLIALAAFFFLFAIAATILISLVDPNDFKEEIGKKVYQKTGRTFRIGGNIRWTFFPWLGLEAQDVRLGNAPDFTQTYFAHVENLSFQLRLLPLLSGQISIDTMRIAGLDLQLERFANGLTNWEILEPIPTSSAPPVPASTFPELLFLLPAAKTNATSLVSVHISHLQISDTKLHFIDHQANTSYRLWNLQSEARGIQLQHPFEVNGTFDWEGPIGHGPVAFKSQITADIDHAHYALTDLHINMETMTEAKAPPLKTDLTINAELDGSKQILSLSRCNGLLFGAPIEATLSLVNFTDPIITGELTSDSWMINNLHLQKIKASLKTENQRLTIAPITFDLYDGHFEGKASIEIAPNKPYLFVTSGSFSHVLMQKLMRDLTKNTSISGVGEATLSFNGEWLPDLQALLNKMQGNAYLQIKEGAITGLDIGSWLSAAQAPLTGEKPLSSTNKTTFSRIDGHITMKNGILRNNDMIMESTLFTAKGQGDLQLQVPIMKSALSYQWQANTAKVTYPLAIRIEGPLDGLAIRPDMDAYARVLLKQTLTRGLLNVPGTLIPGAKIIGVPLENSLLRTPGQ